ncbi:hypothetical protein MY11210_001510 [Beauveria gryllotalpidicola]
MSGQQKSASRETELCPAKSSAQPDIADVPLVRDPGCPASLPSIALLRRQDRCRSG